MALLVGACSSDDSSGAATSTASGPSTSSTAAATTTPATSAAALSTTTARPAPTSAANTTTTAPAVAFPGAEWERADPVAAGFDPAALDAMAATAEAADSSCTVVVRDGKIVDERLFGDATPTTTREAWSVTKSVTSTLVGIAQDQGFLDIDDPAATYIPQWQGTESATVTIRDLLSNISGREWDADIDYNQMAIKADDKTGFAVGLAQPDPPGAVWAYNNSAIQTLSAVLLAATGESAVDFAKRTLLDPIGMASSFMTADAAGNAMMYAGLQTTCRDLARFGYLMLHDGSWNGAQIVSEGYVHDATAVSSSELNAAYGYLWWLNHSGAIASAAAATRGPGQGSIAEGQLLEGASVDIFWALGLNAQIVAVIPDLDIVAVRMGGGPPPEAPFSEPEFTQAVLDAVVG